MFTVLYYGDLIYTLIGLKKALIVDRYAVFQIQVTEDMSILYLENLDLCVKRKLTADLAPISKSCLCPAELVLTERR